MVVGGLSNSFDGQCLHMFMLQQLGRPVVLRLFLYVHLSGPENFYFLFKIRGALFGILTHCVRVPLVKSTLQLTISTTPFLPPSLEAS